MDNPLVSVLMPAYNAASYIREACVSLLTQSYSNLEIIIVDDGSTDDTVFKVKSIPDSRIQLIQNQRNEGLAASLNKSIRYAKGKYLARMDADDICHSKRIKKQVEFLENNPEVSLLGTGLQYFNHSVYKNYFPNRHELCKVKLLFNVCFGHSSLMYRSNVFEHEDNFYKPEYRQYSEDYELYSRLVDRYRFMNLQELLVHYRTYTETIKQDAERIRKSNSRRVRRTMLFAMGVNESEINLDVHCKASDLTILKSKAEFYEIGSWFEFLVKTNTRTRYFDSIALNRQLSEQLFEILYHNYCLKISLSELANYSFFDSNCFTLELRLKYLVKKSFYIR